MHTILGRCREEASLGGATRNVILGSIRNDSCSGSQKMSGNVLVRLL
jgi:hypothetical protein